MFFSLFILCNSQDFKELDLWLVAISSTCNNSHSYSKIWSSVKQATFAYSVSPKSGLLIHFIEENYSQSRYHLHRILFSGYLLEVGIHYREFLVGILFLGNILLFGIIFFTENFFNSSICSQDCPYEQLGHFIHQGTLTSPNDMGTIPHGQGSLNAAPRG